MRVAQFFFLIFIFLKQFYIFKSGTLQVGDIFLLISFLFIIISKRNLSIIVKKDYSLMIFLFFVILINFIHYFIYLDMTFITSSLHYIFNFIVVIVCRQLLKEPKFISSLLNVLKINLILQMAMLILGLGEDYTNTRYMGTFNDPNQFAFFVYINLMLLILGSRVEARKVSSIYYLITLILTFESGSTGMLLAIGTFSVIYIIISILKKINKNLPQLKFPMIKIIQFLIIISFFSIVLIKNGEEIMNTINELPILQRVEQKLDKAGNEDGRGLIEERGIDKLFLYPQKIILGAGQGYYERFPDTAHQGEIHSTLPSILFSYGIIPFILIINWIVDNIKTNPSILYAIYISLLLESFTLLNQRQPFFWMIFVLGSIIKDKSQRYGEN